MTRSTAHLPIRLPNYSVVALTFGLLIVLLGWLLYQHPAVSELAFIEFEVPRYEQRFGFQGGWIEHPLAGGGMSKAYGVIQVDPKGRLAALGFKGGDIPVAHHGDSVATFCWALDQAELGKAADLWVVNARDGRGYEGRRKISIPARASQGEGSRGAAEQGDEADER